MLTIHDLLIISDMESNFLKIFDFRIFSKSALLNYNLRSWNGFITFLLLIKKNLPPFREGGAVFRFDSKNIVIFEYEH